MTIWTNSGGGVVTSNWVNVLTGDGGDGLTLDVSAIAGLQAALDAKAPLASPTFTGTATAPTFSGALTGNASTATALAAGVDRTKLDGIATGATANSSDATLLNRANHTGSQAISTVTSLQTTLDAKAPLASPTFTGTVTAANLTVSGTLSATFAHDLSAFHPGVLANGAVVLRHVAVRAWSLPTNAAGSAVSAGTAATGSTTLTLKKNGSSIGTAVVPASGTTASFTVTATSFAALDVFTVEGPATADTTLANVAISFLGSR